MSEYKMKILWQPKENEYIVYIINQNKVEWNNEQKQVLCEIAACYMAHVKKIHL